MLPLVRAQAVAVVFTLIVTGALENNCSPDVEYLALKYRSFYLLRELTVVIIVAVHIPLQANAVSTSRAALSH